MEQFNRNTYKRQSVAQEFYNSCLGKIIILAVVTVVLLIVAIATVPSDEVMTTEMEDNIRECLQDNDSIRGDAIDAFVDNLSNIFTEADTLRDNQEVMKAYRKYNRLRIYRHTCYSTARIHNNMNPEGIRVGWGFFGIVVPTVVYSDLLLNVGPARGDYNKRLIRDVAIPDEYAGENPNVTPYHYKGNPDD